LLDKPLDLHRYRGFHRARADGRGWLELGEWVDRIRFLSFSGLGALSRNWGKDEGVGPECRRQVLIALSPRHGLPQETIFRASHRLMICPESELFEPGAILGRLSAAQRPQFDAVTQSLARAKREIHSLLKRRVEVYRPKRL